MSDTVKTYCIDHAEIGPYRSREAWRLDTAPLFKCCLCDKEAVQTVVHFDPPIVPELV